MGLQNRLVEANTVTARIFDVLKVFLVKPKQDETL